MPSVTFYISCWIPLLVVELFRLPRTMGDVVKLNVGGRIFMTRVGTLCAEPDSMLARWFDPDSHFARPAEIDGCVFIERDGDLFVYILDHLRGCFNYYPEMNKVELLRLRNEADYYSLGALVEEIDKHFRWVNLSVLKPGQWRCEDCRVLNEAQADKKCCACESPKPGMFVFDPPARYISVRVSGRA